MLATLRRTCRIPIDSSPASAEIARGIVRSGQGLPAELVVARDETGIRCLCKGVVIRGEQVGFSCI